MVYKSCQLLSDAAESSRLFLNQTLQILAKLIQTDIVASCKLMLETELSFENWQPSQH